ncbi:MAG: hypothetical protein IKX41_01635 [Oscillospiraceae bacterium]|nr:hypothetical protein [Oscillospiraceae bacterium]
MSITERVAYLKGLMEGMKVDAASDTGKLLAVMADILEDIALEIDDINENALDLAEEIDQLSDDLGDVEDFLDELCEDDDDECCCCDDDDCCCDDDGEPLFFEIKCPTCGGEFTVDEDVIALDSIKCPKCGETLEFDFDEDDEDGCCCGHDHE